MQYLETIYLDCNSTDIAKPETSDCVRFCSSTIYSHATMISQLAGVFNKAQLLWQEGSITGPYYVSIVFPVDLDHRRKPEDPESSYERIKWYINNMRVPNCGMVISFYQNLNSKTWITTPWHLNEFWPMKRQWSPQNTHITIQTTEKLLGTTAKDLIYAVSPAHIERVEKLADDYGYEVRHINYTVPFDKMYDDIVTSNHHFSFCGATYFFAATVGIPTTGWGYYVSAKIKTGGSYYTYNTAERIYTEMQSTQWANLSTNKARIMQFDHELGVVMNKPISYCNNIDDPDEIDDVFQKML